MPKSNLNMFFFYGSIEENEENANNGFVFCGCGVLWLAFSELEKKAARLVCGNPAICVKQTVNKTMCLLTFTNIR